ncbi:peptidoglycan-binding protein [Devosia sp.]|uniref:peptidoglycan-binding protein n=1 Tax=Devosia sp. TaxID=1871048 RepID=UPI003A910A98
MARAFPQFQSSEYGANSPDQWQDLRNELVSLLDEVESQVGRSKRPDPAYADLGERVRELRDQVNDVPENRHREALRSVQRAVNRFSDRDEGPEQAPFNPRDSLEAAIQQIRSRHYGHASAPYPERRAAPQFDEMAHAVDGIADRMERLEADLRNHTSGQTANTKEIADQLGQLSQVVELLAGAVGETGQVKRLEGQIGTLAKMVAKGAQTEPETLVKRFEELSATLNRLTDLQHAHAQQIDATSLNQRLDDVSATVGRLADLQVQQSERSDTSGINAKLDEVSQTIARLHERQEELAAKSSETDNSAVTERLDDVSATIGRLAELQIEVVARMEEPASGLQHSMHAIEDGLRNIYDRIDTIERTVSLPPSELEKITEQLGKVTSAMQAPEQPQGLIELIDALNERISDVESSSGAVGGLKSDMEALRQTVAEAVEPRFAAIETQLGSLSEQVKDRSEETGVSKIEAQVRQLVARMDQTGEQLSGLAKLYSEPSKQDAGPDLDELADMVAARTSEALDRREVPSGFGETELAEIETRIGNVIRAANEAPANDGMLELSSTIREVGDRLSRLEDMLAGRMDTTLLTPATPREGNADTAAKAAVEATSELPHTAPMPQAKVAPEAASDEADGAPFADLQAELADLRLPVEPAQPSESKAEKPTSKARLSLEPIDDDPIAPLIAEAEAAHTAGRGRDSMPANPSEEAPLVAKPYGDPNPVQRALDAKNGPRQRSAGPATATATGALEAAAPAVDPVEAERPPRPVSSLEASDAAGGPAEEPDPAPAPNRNTFIEAHRRAARQAAGASRGDDVASDSLIGRAFARFNASRNTTAVAAAPEPAAAPAPENVETEAEAETEKTPRKWGFIGRRKLAGDREAPTKWTPDPEPEERKLPEPPEPSSIALGAEETSPRGDDEAENESESFLSRHRRPILLGLSVIALAFMTINFVAQRLGETDEPAAATVQPESAGAELTTGSLPLSPSPMAETPVDTAEGPDPRVISMVDTLSTASIDPSAAQGFVAPATKMPPVAVSVPAIDAIDAEVPKGDRVASLTDDVAPLSETLASPVHVEMPPDGVGPLALREAAANGDVRAQFEVGAIYTEGRAIPEDLETAFKWYERAASQGFAPAQYRLGNLYEVGRGVPKDLAQARLWYQRAAEAGNRMAMHNLAALYASGNLGEQQFDAAANWFERAANRGMTDSQFNLGMLYARGLGVPQNLEESYRWFSLVAANGDADAAKARDDVAASLDAATVKRLNDEVRSWTPEQIDLAANFAPIGTWMSGFDPGAAISNVDVVKGVQLALSKLGFEIGAPDGMAGPKTADAIRSFERATGMSESGTINPRLLAVLGSQPV